MTDCLYEKNVVHDLIIRPYKLHSWRKVIVSIKRKLLKRGRLEVREFERGVKNNNKNKNEQNSKEKEVILFTRYNQVTS